MAALSFKKVTILGATGPTGKFLAREWLDRGVSVRVVSRNEEHVRKAFAGLEVELRTADATDLQSTRAAVEGCDLVFDCIGLPLERMADHPRTAENVARATKGVGGRCVQVSSYWPYIPITGGVVDETHPRVGGGFAVRMRRQAEDILQDSGAAVVNLPDFYGPEVHTSVLNRALQEAAEGKTVNWIGAADTEREHVYVPDAMKAVAALSLHERAYGERWIVPGAGPISLNRVVEIAGKHLGSRIGVRPAGLFMLRVVSLFSSDLRALMPLVPTYIAPIRYDGSKLKGLIDEISPTPYEQGIPSTLDWMRGSASEGRSTEH